MTITVGSQARIENHREFRRVNEVITNTAGTWVKLANPRDGWMPQITVKAEWIEEVR